MPFKDITGKKVGRLTALSFVKRENKITYWSYQCDCGNVKTIASGDVGNAYGKTNSCGCKRVETRKMNCEKIRDSRINIVHGHCKRGQTTRTYSTWQGMKRRCHYVNDAEYHNYGGRGIKVCDRWLNSFDNFLADMGEKPLNLTLERIDVNGNYEPNNCKWATWTEQSFNKRNSLKNRGN
jgi:hypothetical protein